MPEGNTGRKYHEYPRLGVNALRDKEAVSLPRRHLFVVVEETAALFKSGGNGQSDRVSFTFLRIMLPGRQRVFLGKRAFPKWKLELLLDKEVFPFLGR